MQGSFIDDRIINLPAVFPAVYRKMLEGNSNPLLLQAFDISGGQLAG